MTNFTAICKKCGRLLFTEADGKRKIECSFATHNDNNGTYYLCIDCHEGKNKEMFGKNSETDLFIKGDKK